MIKGLSSQLVGGIASTKKLEDYLHELPGSMSDLCQTLSTIMKQLIRAGKSTEVSKVLNIFPIFDKYLSNEVS